MVRKIFRRSLALRVLLISLLFFALPLLVYFLIVFRSNVDEQLRSTVLRLEDLGRSRAQLLGQRVAFGLRTIDMTMALLDLPIEVSRDEVLTAVNDGGRFASIFLLEEREGRTLCTASSDPSQLGRDYSGYRFLEQVAQDGQVSFLAFGGRSFEQYLYVAKRVFDREGVEPTGVLVVSQQVDRLINQLLETESTKYSVELSLIVRSGVIFASGNPELALLRLGPLTPDDERELTLEHNIDPHALVEADFTVEPIGDPPGALQFTRQGRRYIGVAMPVVGTRFALLLDAPARQVYGLQYERMLYLLYIFLGILIVGGAVTFWMTRRMGRPLGSLIHTMHQVSGGDLTARFQPSKMGFEINRLGEIYNETLESLGDNIRRAEEEKVASETLRKELEIGRAIQRDLLPHQRVTYPGVEIAARFEAAQEVGGDFYDIFIKEGQEETKGDLVLTVADAAGKGISACLFSLSLRSMLRSYCAVYNQVGEILREANNLFHHDAEESSMFVTCFMALYDPHKRSLVYSSCGHVPTLVRRRDGQIERLDLPGLPLGVRPLESLEEREVHLESGDLVLFYSDGILEAMNRDNQPYGEARLERFLQGCSGSAEEVADQLLAETHGWAGDAPRFDDTTVMVLKIQ